MKNLFYLLAFVASHVSSFGQRTEFSVQAGSGLFSYRGPNAVNETGLAYFYDFDLANPYGRTSGFSYGLTGQIQGVTPTKYVYGFQLGYEQLVSRVAITSIIGDFGSTPISPSVRGELHNQYLNLNPFIGRRFGNDRLCFDATIGLDAGIGLFSKTIIASTIPFIPASAGKRRFMPDVDFRPRMNVTGYYRSFGLSIGYSRGLSTYVDKRYSNAKVFSQYWRVGVIYRLGKRI